MFATLMMDVEDLITTQSDDATLWIAQAFRDAGLVASFYVVGEKARLWERRGRRDVIEALKWHDIGFHSTWHSIHPTVSEVCQDLDFLSGIDVLWERERQGWQDAERIFGRPLSCWATTGSSWCPSLSGLMGRMGRAYVYSPVQLPGHKVSWFANSLQFSRTPGGFDDVFAEDQAFEAKLRKIAPALVRLGAPEDPVTGLFLGHPTKIISQEFWDAVNFARGSNPDRAHWKPQALKPAELLPRIQKNFRRLLDLLKSQTHIRFVGTSEMARAFDGQAAFLSHSELLALCQRIAREERVLFTDEFTAGEILCQLCEAAMRPSAQYARRPSYGPNALPPASPIASFGKDSLLQAAWQVLDHVDRTASLPSSVQVPPSTLGLGTYFVALAKALLGQERPTAPPDLPYPQEAEEVARDVARTVPGWIIHPEDLRMETILLHTKLQCWTLKPARPRSVA